MLIPKLSRRAALILGKTAGALIFAAVGGAVTWALNKERKSIQAEAERVAGEPELVMDLPREAGTADGPEAVPEDGSEAEDHDET